MKTNPSTAKKKETVPATVRKKAAPKKPALPEAAPAPLPKAVAAPVAEVVAPAESAPTVILVNYDAGFGNSLYLRGEGSPGLSWDKGMALDNIAPDQWRLVLTGVSQTLAVKAVLNDEVWSIGPNVSVPPGETTVFTPLF